MIRKLCAICNSNINTINTIPNIIPNIIKIPIKLCCIDSIQTGIENFEEFSVSKCEKCNTIQLNKLIDLKILYSNSHNHNSVGKVWNLYFETFRSKLQNIIENKIVLEIGDPSGKIANKMKNFSKWIIVEPNKNKNISFIENIEFIEDFFDENFNLDERIDKKIDVITHSHLFEHIYEPNIFLKKCYDILKEDGEMFFGVPNMTNIAENNLCPFLGVFFEHTIFLNEENISWLLNKNGFEIIEIIKYENHSTIYHVKKNKNIIYGELCIKDYTKQLIEQLYGYHSFIEKCNNLDTDFYLFGASYNTQFLLFLGLDKNKILGILDNDPEKQSKYLFGTKLKIYSPNILKNNNCTVVLKNGYYSNEILLQINSINDKINVVK